MGKAWWALFIGSALLLLAVLAAPALSYEKPDETIYAPPAPEGAR